MKNGSEKESNRNTDHSGWLAPLPETLPKPTVWPAVMAMGVWFLAWGILTSWLISAAGFSLFSAGCAGWIAELRKGQMTKKQESSKK